MSISFSSKVDFSLTSNRCYNNPICAGIKHTATAFLFGAIPIAWVLKKISCAPNIIKDFTLNPPGSKLSEEELDRVWQDTVPSISNSLMKSRKWAFLSGGLAGLAGASMGAVAGIFRLMHKSISLDSIVSAFSISPAVNILYAVLAISAIFLTVSLLFSCFNFSKLKKESVEDEHFMNVFYNFKERLKNESMDNVLDAYKACTTRGSDFLKNTDVFMRFLEYFSGKYPGKVSSLIDVLNSGLFSISDFINKENVIVRFVEDRFIERQRMESIRLDTRFATAEGTAQDLFNIYKSLSRSKNHPYSDFPDFLNQINAFNSVLESNQKSYTLEDLQNEANYIARDGRWAAHLHLATQ